MSPKRKGPPIDNRDDYVAWWLARVEGLAATKPQYAPRAAELRAHTACVFHPLSQSAKPFLPPGLTVTCGICGWAE